MTFEPIGRETLSGRIREALYERISTGELEAGARIPSERALSEQFRVARTSVREAIQGLVSLGVIERRGNRAYVTERLPDVVVEANGDDPKSFVRQLFETRRVLELPIISLAAERAEGEGLAEITEIASLFQPGMDIAEFRALDRRFHAAIARASGNPLLVELYGKVLAHLFRSEEFDGLLSASRNSDAVGGIVDDAVERHLAIARAIAANDPQAAIDEGDAHLRSVERSMLDRLT